MPKERTAPLHVAVINGKPLRFFASPMNDGRPDLPWIAIDDLHHCGGLNREERRWFLRKFQSGWGLSKTIATPGGKTVIVPNCMAMAAVDVMIARGYAPKSFEIEYRLVAASAVGEITAHLTFPNDEYFAWWKAALSRWDKARQ
jgi:hypothetical protein